MVTELKIGDYIEKSELDTEQKYNDVVEVFEQWGFPRLDDAPFSSPNGSPYEYLCADSDGDLVASMHGGERKLTYNQVMSLKKTYVDNLNIDKVVSNEDVEAVNQTFDDVKSPKHYQLIEGVESIEIIARSMSAEQWKGFCLGNMLKYRIRAGKKGALQQDIDKANFYGELYEAHLDKCYS